MKLVGANASPKIAGLEELPGKTNYFIGNDPAAKKFDYGSWRRINSQLAPLLVPSGL